jgi:hypothetical protein
MAFDNMKRIMARETILAYPDFNKPFEIHTDASATQLGASISQDGKPITFYSRKLNPAQTRYTMTERESGQLITQHCKKQQEEGPHRAVQHFVCSRIWTN